MLGTEKSGSLTASHEDTSKRGRLSDKSAPDEVLNLEIIKLLEADGRMAFSEIADQLDVSEGTIRNRVNSMKEAGVLRITALVDPAIARYDSDAMLGLKLAPGVAPAAVAARLGRSDKVVYILWVGGRFDLLVEVVAEDRGAFLKFMEDEIHNHRDFMSVETMVGLKNFKNQFLLKSSWEN